MGQPGTEDPLLRGVDLTRLHIARTQSMELPSWARPVIPGTPGPLLYAGLREGQPTVVFAFDIRQSDLPLQVAWPIMISNVAGELLGVGPQQVLDPLAPSTPVTIPIEPDSLGVRVTLPDGTVEQLAPGATGASSVTFVSTRQLGIYRAEVMRPPAPSGSSTTTATPVPTLNPSASTVARPELLLVGIVLLLATLSLSLAARHHLATGRRRLSLVLRTVIMGSLVLALAGFQLVWSVDRLTTVFVV